MAARAADPARAGLLGTRRLSAARRRRHQRSGRFASDADNRS
ncbi:hypothetical protein [Lysobacter gummosus]